MKTFVQQSSLYKKKSKVEAFTLLFKRQDIYTIV